LRCWRMAARAASSSPSRMALTISWCSAEITSRYSRGTGSESLSVSTLRGIRFDPIIDRKSPNRGLLVASAMARCRAKSASTVSSPASAVRSTSRRHPMILSSCAGERRCAASAAASASTAVRSSSSSIIEEMRTKSMF